MLNTLNVCVERGGGEGRVRVRARMTFSGVISLLGRRLPTRNTVRAVAAAVPQWFSAVLITHARRNRSGPFPTPSSRAAPSMLCKSNASRKAAAARNKRRQPRLGTFLVHTHTHLHKQHHWLLVDQLLQPGLQAAVAAAATDLTCTQQRASR